jgi:putative component of membrane protein insertase Oxa1/YidC/SpoIIIJ protein YidD
VVFRYIILPTFEATPEAIVYGNHNKTKMGWWGGFRLFKCKVLKHNGLDKTEKLFAQALGRTPENKGK